MEKRDLSNLWDYDSLSRAGKRKRGINELSHIRFDVRSQGPCIVYVIRRSKPREGFDYGNFAIDGQTMDWLLAQLNGGMGRRPNVTVGYIALVEDFGKEILNWDTAKNIARELAETEPYIGERGNSYFWVDQDFNLIGGRFGSGRTVDDLPF
jgi:hypothetical protein